MSRSILLLPLCLALAGCFGGHEAADTPAPARQMRVDRFGHECFLFTSGLGLKILTDPFRPGTVEGRLPSGLKPDVVLMTTDEPATNNDDAYDNSPVTFRGPIAAGLNNAAGIRIRGIPTISDPNSTERVNLVFAWTMEGVRICFAGNIQRPLTSYEVGQLGPIDVLFLPFGLPASLTTAEREQIVAQLHPRVIVPMGSSSAVNAASLPGFGVYRVPGSSVLLSRDSLPTQPTILVLSNP